MAFACFKKRPTNSCPLLFEENSLKVSQHSTALKREEQNLNEQAQAQRFWIPGATTIGVVCSDGVVLASEKRVSYGYMVMSRVGKKVFKIADRIGAACAGLVSDMQMPQNSHQHTKPNP